MISYIVLLLNLMRQNTVFNKLFNCPSSLILFIWETRLGKDRIQDQSTDPYSKQNGEQN